MTAQRESDLFIVSTDVWLKNELDEKTRIAKFWKKGDNCIKKLRPLNNLGPPYLLPAVGRQKHKGKSVRTHARNYNFECDRLIELSDNNLASEVVKNNRTAVRQPAPTCVVFSWHLKVQHIGLLALFAARRLCHADEA